MKILQKIMARFLSSWLLFAPGAIYATPIDQPSGQAISPPVEQQTPEELQQLIAPIALYPDALVSQILAASTYSTEIVEADRWVQEHPNLKGKDLANAVGQQSWDPAAETSVAVDFTVARPSVGLQSRTPKLVRIPARLEGTTTVAPRAATRIAVARACTAAVSVKVVFTHVALAAAVD